MQYIYIPTVQTLRGEAAIKALNDYVINLEEQTPEELTDAQTRALMTFAQGLISSIQAEKCSEKSPKSLREMPFESFSKLKDVVLPRLSRLR